MYDHVDKFPVITIDLKNPIQNSNYQKRLVVTDNIKNPFDSLIKIVINSIIYCYIFKDFFPIDGENLFFYFYIATHNLYFSQF